MSYGPKRPSASTRRSESMRELLHHETFSQDGSCPIRIELEHLPAIKQHLRLTSEKKVSQTYEGRDLTLPEINSEGGNDENYVCYKENLKTPQSLYKFVKQCQDKTLGTAGPSACKRTFDCHLESQSSVLVKEPEEKLEESNALKRWEFWMEDKRRVQEYLSRRLNQSPYNLRLGDSDKIRKVLEEKWLRIYTQIPEADKWRGHPYRWKAQLRLFSHNLKLGDRKSEAPDYYAVKTGLDNGEIPEMEFVGIPKTIQKEKGLLYQQSVVEDQLDNAKSDEAKYLRKRRKKLKPHHIKMDDLEVIGKKIFQTRETFPEYLPHPDLPKIVISEYADMSKQEPYCTFCLAIGDDVIKYDLDDCSPIPSKSYSWHVKFGVNTVGSIVQNVLKVENRGMLAVRYRWVSRVFESTCNLEKLNPKEYEPWFFFNKNSGFFLPGQICNLTFYHYSKRPGIRNEIWYLETEPPLTKNNNSCSVILSAIATEENCEKVYAPEKYISDQVRGSIVECMIQLILRRVFIPSYNVRDIEYRSIFSRKLLFECNNPKYYYNSTIVTGLNEIYDEITQNSRGEWDLSLETLCRTVNTYKESSEKNSILYKIAEQAKLLLKPTYVSMKQNKRYRMTYGILCNAVNKMDEIYDSLRSSLSQKIEPYDSEAGAAEEEMGEFDYCNSVLVIRPVTAMFCETLFYIKVYSRLCNAVESIVGVLETKKLFGTSEHIKYKAAKPLRKTGRHTSRTLQNYI